MLHFLLLASMLWRVWIAGQRRNISGIQVWVFCRPHFCEKHIHIFTQGGQPKSRLVTIPVPLYFPSPPPSSQALHGMPLPHLSCLIFCYLCHPCLLSPISLSNFPRLWYFLFFWWFVVLFRPSLGVILCIGPFV